MPTPMEKVKEAGRRNAMHAAFTEDELDALAGAVQVALEEKRKAYRATAGQGLTEKDYGIPQLEQLRKRLSY
ncbi:hypothetical protein [Cupriavidus sp. DL-D2]|uniref:hypothetical protein n=1 Tax=Cupriavidus sp. DL-D2 TaxID=3144974 RepID=UPI00321568F7